MKNLNLIETQPRWRVAIVALFAKLMGVTIHVKSIPFGSNRTQKHNAATALGNQATSSGTAHS